MPLLDRWREHWLITGFVLAGIALRVCTSLSYRPALLFSDSFDYLKHSKPLRVEALRPVGYSVFLWPFVHSGAPLWLVPAVQHLLGLALGLGIYAFCRRRSLPTWGAALAALPVLIDPLQLVLEQYVLSDLLFEVLLTTGFMVLLWHHRPGWGSMIAAGLLVAASGLVRDAGVPMVVVLVATAIGLRVGAAKVAAVAAAFAVPLLSYAAIFDHSMHSFALQSDGPHFLYSRIEPFADCHGVTLTATEQQLCPAQPVGQRPNSVAVMFDFHTPQWTLTLPAGTSANTVLTQFNKKIIRAHPWSLIHATAADLGRSFAIDRRHDHPGFPASTWQFHRYYWPLLRFFAAHKLNPHKVPHTSASKPGARFLTDWGRFVWTPGPLLALGALLAALVTAGVGRSRWSGLRCSVGGLGGAGLGVVLVTAALSGPSWRYQLPQLALLPPAAALAIAALRGAAGQPPTDRTHPLDRLADRLRRDRTDPARPRRREALALGVVISVVVALVVTLAGLASGWAAAPFAATVGVLAAAVTAAALARSYTRPTPARPSA